MDPKITAISQIIFITGIGTDVGKTLVSAIVTEALKADYWKPVQAGFADGTDAGWLRAALSNKTSVVHEELYRLQMPASPHIAAREEGVVIDAANIAAKATTLLEAAGGRPLVVEGAGGLLVPLGENLMVADLAKQMNAKVVLVSRNYLGSINHSLLTAACCRQKEMDVAGWIFNDDYLSYEDEIVRWSGYPSLGRIAKLESTHKTIIAAEAERLAGKLVNVFS